MLNPAPHPDWYYDGIEDGEALWRLDLPEVQVQIFRRSDGNRTWRVFIEHDVRDGPDGERRVRYACNGWPASRCVARSLLAMPRDRAAAFLAAGIAEVKAMPNMPEMCDAPADVAAIGGAA